MESQPKNPEFRNNPENFHQCFILNIHSDTYILDSYYIYLHDEVFKGRKQRSGIDTIKYHA